MRAAAALKKHDVPIVEASEKESNQYLTFYLGNELFAVGILSIREIIQFGQLTAVPLMPEYIRGVINLRGAVVPVIDLYARFGRGVAPVSKRTCIVIIEVMHDGTSYDIGIMVDAVSAVIDITTEQIEPPPVFGSTVSTDFIEGMGKLNEQFVIILNVSHTFSMEQLTTTVAMHKGDQSHASHANIAVVKGGDDGLAANTVRLVQESWGSLASIAPKVAEMFYKNLFERAPELRQLFRGDMTEQGEKLMQMIGAAVGKLNDLDALTPILESLGKRHATYHVRHSDYETVGAALLQTLEQGLGKDFTPMVKEAWSNVYRIMAKVMTEATTLPA